MEHITEYRQQDLINCLEKLQMRGPLNEKDARELERLLFCKASGMLDEQVLSLSATLGNPSLQETYFQDPASNIAYNGLQNTPASFSSSGNTVFTSPYQNQPEQFQPARSLLAMSTPDAAFNHTQGSAGIAKPEPSHVNDAPGADAAAIVPQPIARGPPPPEVDGLRFNSFAAASTTADLVFREAVTVVLDDVDGVIKYKRDHVKSLIQALKQDGYMPAPNEWRGAGNVDVPLTEGKKAAWRKWQEKELKKVRANLKMPNIDIKLELLAWEIFEEIIKVHRIGTMLSKQAKGNTSRTCSQRVKDALETMRKWANVRLKLINGDNIPGFGGNPQAYASVTFRSVRNNEGRKNKPKNGKKSDETAGDGESDENENDGVDGETCTSPVRDPCGASENGAIARKFMPATEARKRKRNAVKNAQSNGNGQQHAQQGAQAMPTQELPIWANSVDQRGRTFSGKVPSLMPTPFDDYSKDLIFDNFFDYTSFNNSNTYNPNGSAPSLHDDQMPVVTQHKRRRAENVDHPGRQAATFDAAVPGAMPPPPFPTQVGMPEGRPSKKRKTGGSPRNEA
jgi:hypothetical protein